MIELLRDAEMLTIRRKRNANSLKDPRCHYLKLYYLYNMFGIYSQVIAVCKDYDS
jgi:23S rRNA maturation mini-RNase III